MLWIFVMFSKFLLVILFKSAMMINSYYVWTYETSSWLFIRVLSRFSLLINHIHVLIVSISCFLTKFCFFVSQLDCVSLPIEWWLWCVKTTYFMMGFISFDYRNQWILLSKIHSLVHYYSVSHVCISHCNFTIEVRISFSDIRAWWPKYRLQLSDRWFSCFCNDLAFHTFGM